VGCSAIRNGSNIFTQRTAKKQTVIHSPLNAEAQVGARVSSGGICGGQSDSGQVFLRVLPFSTVSITPSLISTLIYHLGNKQ
jgi:hypothetical protein